MGKNYHAKIISTLEKKQISRAIFYLKKWADEISTDYYSEDNFISDTHITLLRDIEQTYNDYLEQFDFENATPQTDEIIINLTIQCYQLADYYKRIYSEYAKQTIEERLMFNYQPVDINSTFEKIIAYNHQIDLQLSPNRKQYESNLYSVFNYYWLYFRHQNANHEPIDDITPYKKYVVEALDNDYQLGDDVRPLVISALTLNILRDYSEEHIIYLIEALDSPNITVKSRAYVGLVLIISHYYNRYKVFPHFKQIIDEEIINQPDRLKVIHTVTIDLIRTLETEHIRQIMSNEITTEIEKKLPDIQNGIISIDDLTANTKWSDYENSLQNKLIKLQELLHEGSDIHYNTFYQQKKLPFFNNIAHWFLPFDPQWSDISQVYIHFPRQLQNVIGQQLMCDSDLYSLHLAIAYLSNSNQDGIKQFLVNNLPDISEETEEKDFNHEQHLFANTVNNYIQNLYRFFKNSIFGIEDYFNDIPQYATTIIPLLFKSSASAQYEFANFYFNKEQYAPALSLFKSLETEMASNELFQKMGYSAQKQGDKEQAFKYYTIANTFTPNDLWTLQHMVACTTDSQQLHDIYDNILQLDENNQNALLGKALLYMKRQQYEQAINIYYKLDFIYPDTLTIERQLAICAMYKQDFSTAIRYWNKITDDTTNSNDLINKAHTYLLQHDITNALQTYQSTWQATEKKSDFWALLRSDEQMLLTLGLTHQQFHYINEMLINELYVKTIN